MSKKNEATNATQTKDSAENTTVNTLEERKAHDKAVRAKNDKEMKVARKKVAEFMDTQKYTSLPEDVKSAIKRIVGKKRAAATGTDTFASKLVEMFPTVSSRVAELDIFMKTKMGRGEFRKRVRETLKKAEHKDRMWIEFDEGTEEWIYLAKGIKQPKGFAGKAID